MESYNAESLRSGHRKAVLFCLTIIPSVIFYAGLVEYLARSSPPFRGFSPIGAEFFSKLKLLLLGVTAVTFVVIPIIRNRVLANAPGARNASGDQLRELPDKLVSNTIISIALCESIAIYGLVLFFLNGARQEFYLFFLLSLVALIFHFPRFSRWEDWARSAAGPRIIQER